MDNYIRSLANPFDTTIDQPKFLDGRISRTSGIRLRTTGVMTAPTTGFLYIFVFPGVSNVFCACSSGDFIPDLYSSFAQLTTDIDAINRYRLVGAGLKMELLNSADSNGGTFEAIRFNAVPMLSGNSTNNSQYLPNASAAQYFNDIANNPSYVNGRLRDIGNYLFRLNFRNAELTYKTKPSPVTVGATIPNDNNFDTICIRVRGSSITAEPSILMFDAVGCNEVEYVDGIALNRLMTDNKVVPNIDELANRLNIKKAAIKMAPM